MGRHSEARRLAVSGRIRQGARKRRGGGRPQGICRSLQDTAPRAVADEELSGRVARQRPSRREREMESSAPMLVVRGLSKQFGVTRVLNDVDIEIDRNQV